MKKLCVLFLKAILLSKGDGKKKSKLMMKFYVTGNFHFVYVMSLLFNVISRLYPKERK